MEITEQTIPGTQIPQVPKELFRSEGNPTSSIFAERRWEAPLLHKIVDDKRDTNGNFILDEKGQRVPWIDYPETGGVFVYHKSFPYPEKGYRDDYMMASVQFAKRFLINWINFASCKYLLPVYLVLLFLPWKFKIRILEKWIDGFIDISNMIDVIGHHFIFKTRYYSAGGRELIRGCTEFLKALGILETQAEQFSVIFVSFIDHDVAYRYRLCDILSETTQEKMLNPRKEIKRLIKILAERDPQRPHLIQKFDNFAKLLTYTLWIPRVRRAFDKAIKMMDFELLGLDEADRYHVRNMGGYNYFGMTIEERNKKWPPEQHLYIEYKI